MGNNSMCCQNNTSANLDLDQITITHPTSTTFLNFMIANPTICSIVKQKGHFYSELQSNKSSLPKKIKEYVLLDGTFLTDRNYSSERNSQTSVETLPVTNKFEKQNGFGVMLYNNKNYYQGQWRDGNKYGKGLLACEDGTYYLGEWKKDVASGKGIYESIHQNTSYNGEWLNGLKNGKGVEKYEDGSVYNGDFINGEKNGRGKLNYSNGTQYQGQFCNNYIQGHGTFKGKNHIYEGEWKDGKMHGTGKSEWKNEEGKVVARYLGQYKQGIKQGFGQYTDSKGVTYKAIWTNGQINQKGPVVTQKCRQLDGSI